MFYCDACAAKKAWPKSIDKSVGTCEICKKTAKCNNVPSSNLPSLQPVAPITPKEAAEKKFIPKEVIEVFNQLIGENFYNGEAIVKQADVLNRLTTQGFEAKKILDNQWLREIEDLFRKAGWRVIYKKNSSECEQMDDELTYYVFKPK